MVNQIGATAMSESETSVPEPETNGGGTGTGDRNVQTDFVLGSTSLLPATESSASLTVASEPEVVYENVKRVLTVKDIKEIAKEIINRLKTQNQFVNRLKAAEEKAGKKGNMLIALRFPIVVEAQVQILEELNVGTGEEGLKSFLFRFNRVRHEDMEAAALFKELKDIWFFDMDAQKDQGVIEKAV